MKLDKLLWANRESTGKAVRLVRGALWTSAHALTFSLLIVWQAPTALAQMPDISAGKRRAEVCMACHGENGRSVVDGVPHLAGQNRDYLAQALKDYRLGQDRRNPTMTEMAKPLSDADIDNISGFFHGLRAER
jgi:cytochrome c553